ncbi:uncharacterized protein LOC117606006 isoform X2 [Osmia lignaria lignaria]|uniref:uncharacterized protein LOC117606006 isoform X2 n=1 Tax=Osmia lignaria lignaria TaxID=1437193 RepID=UPI00402B5C6F
MPYPTEYRRFTDWNGGIIKRSICKNAQFAHTLEICVHRAINNSEVLKFRVYRPSVAPGYKEEGSQRSIVDRQRPCILRRLLTRMMASKDQNNVVVLGAVSIYPSDAERSKDEIRVDSRVVRKLVSMRDRMLAAMTKGNAMADRRAK